MIPDEQAGWMERCVLIGAVRQAGRWASALQAAATANNVEMVVLDGRPPRRHAGDENRVFVALDKTHLAPTATASRVAVLDGVDKFSGLGLVAEEDARVHVIEVTRFAVEALDWANNGTIITSDIADFSRKNRAEMLVMGVPVYPPDLVEGHEDQLDRQAAESLSYLRAASSEDFCRWGPPVFVYDQAAISLDDRAAVLDMTGPPRPLVRGPYLWGPRGRRRITARFSLDENASRHELQFRWGPPLSPTLHYATPERAGVYEIVLEADWPEIDGMEFTIALVHGCVDGTIEFLGAKLDELPIPAIR